MTTDSNADTRTVRRIVDPHGVAWEAIGVDDIVAHGKLGVRLAFRPADDPTAEPLSSRVTFNSREAADFALRTMGEKELLRRLTLAQAQAGRV